jgi:hypothetical protein
MEAVSALKRVSKDTVLSVNSVTTLGNNRLFKASKELLISSKIYITIIIRRYSDLCKGDLLSDLVSCLCTHAYLQQWHHHRYGNI